ncbi:hypothetical protein JAMGFMIE_00441 [Rheinheimera sp. MM224]|nr:hypothetical protein JAMGFMIE_00441 [Rheinheimera sp. MM224]
MDICVYADWTESIDPILVGTLRSSEIRGSPGYPPKIVKGRLKVGKPCPTSWYPQRRKRAIEGLLSTQLERHNTFMLRL